MGRKKVVFFRGDGIGPEIMDSVLSIVEQSGVPIDFLEAPLGLSAVKEYHTNLPEKAIELIKLHKVALKGPTTTPDPKLCPSDAVVAKSANVAMRQRLNLFANIRPMAGQFRLYEDAEGSWREFDIVVFRENTEGLYSGNEILDKEGTVHSDAVCSIDGCRRISRAAFEWARKKGLKRVTLGHKANTIPLAGQLFQKQFFEISQDYPKLKADYFHADNLGAKIIEAVDPLQVIVLPNLMGDIETDIFAALAGGIDLVPGANIGSEYAVFEAIHGSAPDIAGENIANPTALIRAYEMMLDHLELSDYANQLRAALSTVFQENKGLRLKFRQGKISTSEFTKLVLAHI